VDPAELKPVEAPSAMVSQSAEELVEAIGVGTSPSMELDGKRAGPFEVLGPISCLGKRLME
jgi:hypothetical protein